MSDILVDPTDRCRGLVVAADVTHELARKVFDRSEDTSGNHVMLNLGKPNFDLVKPTGVGRGVVDPNRAVSLQKCKDFLRLVRAQIVGDDMDLTTCRLALYDLRKEIDELGAGVACAGFRQDLSGLSVQSAVERKGSMAVVLSHAVPHGREKVAKPDPGDPALGWRSSRPRRRQRHALAGRGTTR
jgi:hypothetical protein